jgi:hypothetical protein
VEVLSLQVFVSLMLVTGSIVLFVFSCRQRDFDHADRLALLPLDDDPSAQGAVRSTPGANDDHE